MESNSGLIYQPLIQSLFTPDDSHNKLDNNYLGAYQGTSDFVVEPVKEWIQPRDFNWSNITPSNYVEKFEPGEGKVYGSNEKDSFKADMLEAYTNALIDRGFDRDSAIEYGKRIVAQDALESRYGQSKLAKFYNFGGIKDFRENVDSLRVDTKEYINGRMHIKKQPFRKFKDLREYVNYKLDLLGNSNFDVFSYEPDLMYAKLVASKKKYATDPDYEKKLNKIYYLLWK